MNLIDEVTEMILTLEEAIPANPASKQNERLEKGMQRSLAQYFKDVDQAIDWNTLEQIYYRNVKQE